MPSGAPIVTSICSECGASVEFELGALQVKCTHCDAGLAVDKGLRLVRLSCPRCSGNFYYIDGSMCGKCPYCDAQLLAVSHDRLLRYVVLPAQQQPEEARGATLVLLPFWHLSGLVYGWDIGSKVEIEEDRATISGDAQRDSQPMPTTTRKDSGPMKVFRGRVVDLSIPDPATLAVGVTSLRLRGAIFPLEPFSAGHESLGRLTPATLDVARAREQLCGRALRKAQAGDGLTQLDIQRQDLVAETFSLFYYPFWLREGVCPAGGEGQTGGVSAWDGVSGLPEPLAPGAPAPAHGASTAFDDLQIIELVCGACNQPLHGGNRSTVLPCTSCGAVWQVGRDGLRPFPASWAKPQLPGPRLVWLPFWRMDVRVSYRGSEAATVGALRALLGITRAPGETPSAPESSPLGYYAPAFGALKAPRLDFAARDMTRTQPRLEPFVPVKEGSEVYNCFYDPVDAQRLAYTTWIGLLPGTAVKALRSLRIDVGPAALWYVPFDNRGRELVNLLTGIRYDWAAFRGVRH
jgi:Zn finger protein HypA/HybF involved in hydrogenase expression